MRSFHFSLNSLMILGLATVTATAYAATSQQSLQTFKTQLRQNWGSRYVSSVRLNPADQAMVNVYANSRWNTLTAHQKKSLGLKWWYRWAKLRNRDEKYVVVDVKTSNGYPLLHCYGKPWNPGTCR
jgi:hypothetical protein